MIVICEDAEIFSEASEKHSRQLQRLFIRAAEGQHVLYFSDPQKVINSRFFEQAVAAIDKDEWKEIVKKLV